MATEEERKKWIVEREQIVNNRAKRWNEEISVLITAHASQRAFMKACIASVKSLGWLLMVYDNPHNIRDHNHLPSAEVIGMIDQFFIKHVTKEMPGPTYPQFWNFKHGVDILLGSLSKYIFVIGADSILEKPEGLTNIFTMLGDNDIIACSSRDPKRHKWPYCNTKSLLAKKEAFKGIIDFIERGFIPFDHRYGNMENRFGLAIKELGIKEVVVPELPQEDQFAYGYDENDNCINRGTWGGLLGYRHLGGEHKIRRTHKKKPIEKKYFDVNYITSKEKETMVKFWETGDKKFLEAWWKT